MVMKSLRDGASGGFIKYILFGFLILAVGGLVMMDIGGFFRGGISSTDIARAGKDAIPISSFDRTVRQTINRLGMSAQEAYRLGYINQLLSNEIRNRLLNQAALDTGVLVSKERVAGKIGDIVKPLAGPDQSSKDVLNTILLNQGLNEGQFVESMRRDMTNSLLTTALENTLVSFSDSIAHDLFLFQNETRDIDYIVFPDKDIKSLPEPDDSQLQNLYSALRENYAQAETRTIKLITIKDEALKKTLDISEEEIRQNYDDNIDFYTVPETRTLAQALLPTQEQANTVLSAVKNGKTVENAVEDITGNTAAYLGEQRFENEGLLKDIKDAVLNAKQGDILDPINSPLGWHVIAVKKISPGHTKNFDQVKAEIKEDLLSTLVIDQQYALANTVDDLLASGASLEEVAAEVDLDIRTLPAINNLGLDKNGQDILKDFGADRSTVLETSFQLEEGESSAVLEMNDGHFMALHLESLSPKTYKAFEEVRADLLKRWMDDQKRLSNKMRTTGFLAEVTANNSGLKHLAQSQKKPVQKAKNLMRGKEPPKPFTAKPLLSIFQAKTGQPMLIDIEGGTALAMVTAIHLSKKINESDASFEKLKADLASGNQSEGVISYLQNKHEEYGATVNVRLLERVYGPESQSY